MRFRRYGVRAFFVAGMALAFWPEPSRALEAINFDLAVTPAQSARAAPASTADDADEESFFSAGTRRRSDTTGTVATIGPLPPSVVSPRSLVDVAATCRAVLADNLNHYNHNFIEGCHRVVRQGARR